MYSVYMRVRYLMDSGLFLLIDGTGIISTYTFNEVILAATSLVWSAWAVYLNLTSPWSSIRIFFMLAMLIPAIALTVMQSRPIHRRLNTKSLGGYPAAVRIRQIAHLALGWTWLMVAVAICLGNITPPIHCLPYIGIGFIHWGKALRLAHYDS